MKIGVTSGTVACFGEQRFEKLRELGFDAVDFNLMDVAAPVYGCSEEEPPALFEKVLAILPQLARDIPEME